MTLPSACLRPAWRRQAASATRMGCLLATLRSSLRYEARVAFLASRAAAAPWGDASFCQGLLGRTAEVHATLADRYYGLKRANGYTYDAIERKRLSLAGVLVPLTAALREPQGKPATRSCCGPRGSPR